MSIPLYYSVMLYAIPAFYARHSYIGAGLSALLPFAVLNHAKNHEEYRGKSLVRFIDRAGSHAIAACLAVASFRPTLTPFAFFVFWVCLVYTALVFHVLKKRTASEESGRALHASMHVVSCFGIMVTLI